MVPDRVAAARRRRCDCGASEAERHLSSCAVWPRPRFLYHWLAEKSYTEFARMHGVRWSRLFQLAVWLRHPVLWSRG